MAHHDTARMPQTPLVSVLMTAWNREAFIAEAIESVLAQTCADFELVVVDDASTDRTVEIARAYAAPDPRVRVVANEKNLGDYGNRARAATLARGEFLKYHDSDDLMYPHCLSTMLEALRAEPRASLALSGPRAWPGGPVPMLLTPRTAYEREFLGSGLFHLGPAAALFRTQVFRELGGFPVAGVASDYLFWVEAFARVNVVLVSGDLFYYRVHPNQQIAGPDSDREYAKASAAAWRMLHSPVCPLAGEALEQARRNFVYTQFRGMVRHLRRGRPMSTLDIWRHVGFSLRDWARYLRRPRRTAYAGTSDPFASRTADAEGAHGR